MARILRLPSTPAGRELLRDMVRMIGGWDVPDGSGGIEDVNWDEFAVQDLAAAKYQRELWNQRERDEGAGA